MIQGRARTFSCFKKRLSNSCHDEVCRVSTGLLPPSGYLILRGPAVDIATLITSIQGIFVQMYADLCMCVCVCYHVNVGPLVSGDELSTAQQLINPLDPRPTTTAKREPYQPPRAPSVSITHRQTAEADLHRNAASCWQPCWPLIQSGSRWCNVLLKLQPSVWRGLEVTWWNAMLMHGFVMRRVDRAKGNKSLLLHSGKHCYNKNKKSWHVHESEQARLWDKIVDKIHSWDVLERGFRLKRMVNPRTAMVNLLFNTQWGSSRMR